MMKETMLQTRGAAARSGERNLGVDLLRCVSMLLIAIIHIYNQGGVAGGFLYVKGAAFQMNYPMRLICMASVDLYALISGYVMLNGRFRPGRLLELWLQVVFIGVVECIVGTIIAPGTVTDKIWKKAFLPITQVEYWYFTAYAGVFALSPLLNRGVRALTERQGRAMIAGVFCLFSLGWLIGKLEGYDSFVLSNGYTTIWLVLLYILGASIKKTGFLEKTKTWKLLFCAAGCIAILWALRNVFYIESLPQKVRAWGDLLLSYCNPLLVVFSICVFALFARMRIGGAAAAFVKWLSPLTFGVYLIHVHPVAWSYFSHRYSALASLRARWILPAVIAAGIGLLLSCAFVDWLRSLLFKLCRVRKLCDRLERRMKRLWQESN